MKDTNCDLTLKNDKIQPNFYWTFKVLYGKNKKTFYGSKPEAEKKAKKMSNDLGATISVYSSFGYEGAVYPDKKC